MKYKSYRIVDGKSRKVIVDENRKIVNKNPNKEELKDLGEEPYKIKRKPYTDNELLGYLKQFYEENRRSPMRDDFNDSPKYPSHSTYIKRFGGWNESLKMAGLEVNKFTEITEDELLGYLKQFYKENGRPPVVHDFMNNHKYPNFSTYQRHFGSWQKALKLVGLDIDTIARKGILQNSSHKGRLFEIYVKEHFVKSVDLSGENYGSPFDGRCPKGQTYNAKSSGLIHNRYWLFALDSIYRDEIEWFYLGAFDKDYKKLLYVWRIPGDFIDGQSITIGIDRNYTYNVENMKEYEITDRFKDIDLFK